MTYEPCVIGSDGRCTRWSHDHDTPTPAPTLTDEQIDKHLALIRSLFILGAKPDDAADHAQGIDIFDRTIAAVERMQEAGR